MSEHPEPEVAGQHDVSRTDRVQQAVEAFVELHTAGKAPDPMTFAAGHPQDLRAEILSQCREFLTFDGMLGHQEWQQDEPDEPGGRLFGDFVIQEELGRGGMGVVYLAHQRSLDRRVALKVMASGLTLSKRHVERFRREAMATAQLRHPAIVPVHSLIEVDGTFALAMDYVAGRNLADILDDLRLRNRDAHDGADGQGVSEGSLGLAPEKGYVAECAMLTAQVASALAAAHHNQVVHRDLKPRNLMVDDRRQVRLLDFGLAKSLDATRESLSMSGEITGTAHYMSPEQTLAKRVDVDHRADIWSLGVILYELLTLRRPFDGKNLQQIVYEICFKEPVALQRRNPKVPRDLVTICAKALEKDPQNRYQTAADFEADLQRFLRWEPVHAKPVGAWTRASKFLRRHRTETAIATALLLTLTTVLAFFWYRGAVDAQQADALLQTAARSAEAGDYAQAIKLTNRALGLRNDEVTRERLGRYHAENKRIENEAAWKVAESKRLLEHDRETALLLALDAERQVSSPKTRSAVLDALGSGLVARTLPMPVGVRAVDAAFSPSGQHVATAGYGGTLQVFDGDDDAPPRTLTGHGADKPVASVAFVDDDTLISAGMDRTLRIWHPGRVREPLVVPLGEIVPATMVLDQGRRRALLTLYNPEDHVYGAQAFDARSGRELGPFVDHHSYVMAAALRGDGAVAASCCASNRLRIWNVDDGASLADEPLPFDGALASAIAFSADGTLVAIGARDGGISFHDARSGAQLGRVRHSDFVTSLAFSPAGDRLLSGSRDFTARLWAFERQGEALAVREAGTLGGNDGQVLHVAFDRTGTLAATAAGKANGAIRVFDAAGDGGRRAIHEYTIREPVERVAFAPDGRRLLAVTSRRAIVWNFSSARGAISMRQAGKVPALAFAGGDAHLVTAGDDECLRRWNSRDGRLDWQTERLGNPIDTLAVDRDGERLACALVGGAVQVHAMHDGALQFALAPDGFEVASMRFVDDDRLLTAGAPSGADDSGALALWDLAARERIARHELPAPAVCTAVSPDGSLVAIVTAGQQHATLLTLPGFEPRARIGAHDGPLRCVAFSPDGRRLLTAGDDRAARVWDLDGVEVLSLATDGRVRHASFSTDGTLLLTCSIDDGSAQLWRTADGAELLHFDGHLAPLTSGAISGDGKWAATSAQDGSIWIWPTDPVAVARRLPLHTPDHPLTTRPR